MVVLATRDARDRLIELNALRFVEGSVRFFLVHRRKLSDPERAELRDAAWTAKPERVLTECGICGDAQLGDGVFSILHLDA